MGETYHRLLPVGFVSTIKLEFHGGKVSSDASLFPFRDLNEAAQLTKSSATELLNFRTGSNVRHSMLALLRQSIYGHLARHENVKDAERLRDAGGILGVSSPVLLPE